MQKSRCGAITSHRALGKLRRTHIAFTVMSRKTNLFPRTQKTPLNLAGSIPGQRIKRNEIDRYFMWAEPLGSIQAKFLRYLRAPCHFRSNISNNLFTVNMIRATNDSNLPHCWMAEQYFFDLAWCYVFSSAINHLA